jgi:hypothetical protein
MLDVQKWNRGRTKTLTDSTRKRHKKEGSAKYNKTRVSILRKISTAIYLYGFLNQSLDLILGNIFLLK